MLADGQEAVRNREMQKTLVAAAAAAAAAAVPCDRFSLLGMGFITATITERFKFYSGNKAVRD